MKILVTGGAGFIGSHIVDELLLQGNEVAIVDNLSTGKSVNLNEQAKFYHIDIVSDQLQDVFTDFQPEVVFHLAAQVDVNRSLENPILDQQYNIGGCVNLLECCRRSGVKKIVYSSSAAVYGVPQYSPIDESHPITPISFYGISKFTPEMYIKTYSDLYNIDYAVLRYSNAYGPRQSSEGEGGVISIFVDQMLANNDVKIFGDGSQTRDFIFVKDIVTANLAALDIQTNIIVNISTNQKISLNDLFITIKRLTDYPKEVIYCDKRAGDIQESCLANEEAGRLLGWSPSFNLESGLSETIEYNKCLSK
ncbi:NAD-dependent epimerase/dehydratase family protein [Paenibacillus hunanensis]|uniref:UDP-glucose 4-epimerase n=1 Tax=Paenibacillus hunanensis TaxID=539262 RepID=A0ABU1ITH5_9BACL|nr:NAD-dependent epimerase/dehydratase family protein [Paenibacillus hunanensis]MDR6242559.1 UDP-glucose 4-epimerase [Paenibacillus hunanensis]GGJ00974.1 UDP-glucose 4-epimerase [Paenibacillus hunanensis]